MAKRVGTTAEAARLAGRTPQTIRNWVRAGTVRGRRVGDRLVIDLASLPKHQEASK
jgi:predicted transcriptional regulator